MAQNGPPEAVAATPPPRRREPRFDSQIYDLGEVAQVEEFKYLTQMDANVPFVAPIYEQTLQFYNQIEPSFKKLLEFVELLLVLEREFLYTVRQFYFTEGHLLLPIYDLKLSELK
jgi:hypothetical protein